MIEGQPSDGRREFINGLETPLRGRVLNAQPLELLSNRDDKLVEVVRDINGSSFVRRSYSQAAVHMFERVGIPFTEAWGQMHHIFGAVDVKVVPSILLHPSAGESEFPVVVASEYLENDNIAVSSTDAKIQIATSLGAIPYGSGKFLPGFEIFMPDMFRVGMDNTGIERLVLVDIDPYLSDRRNVVADMHLKDIWDSEYIKKISSLLEGWCQPAERRAVISAFIRSVGSKFDFDSRGDSRTFQAIMGVHSMAQGMNLRSF